MLQGDDGVNSMTNDLVDGSESTDGRQLVGNGKKAKRFSGVIVIWKIVWDSRYNINNSVISRSFFELRAPTSRRRKTFGSGVRL